MNPPKLLVALRPLEIKQLFDYAIRIYRQRFPAMFLAMAVVQLPLSLIGIIAMVKIFAIMKEVEQLATAGTEPGMDWFYQHVDTGIMLAGLLLAAAAYQLLITPLGTMACARLAVCALHSEAPSLNDCVRFSLKRYWPTQVALATYVLPLLVLAVLMLALVVIGQAVGNEAAVISGAIIGLALILLGSVAIFLSYFRFFPALTGILQAAEELPEGGMGSQGLWLLRRSWEITSGHYWRMLGLTMLAMLAVNFISRGISETFGYIVFLISEISQGSSTDTMIENMLTNQQDPLTLGISMMLATLAVLIFPPFIHSFQMLLYYDVRCRKEAYDLELLLGTAPLPPS